MSKRYYLFASVAAIAATAGAQVYNSSYIKWPASDQLHNYVQQWNNGTLNMEDENFFISRVKPHKQFRNLATQVKQNINETNDKRLVFWVPVGDTNTDNGANALPNGRFDSETFSMWSYVTHYGDWTSPHGWVPGAFADVAHKNGVAVSGVASIPFGGLTSNWSTCLSGQANLDNEAIAKFLYYHGVDGLGYNSEFNGGSSYVQKIAAQHEFIIKYLNDKGIHTAEHIWYDGTSYYGSIAFDRGLGSHNQGIYGSNGNRRASLFFNYNWGRTSNLTSSVNESNNMGIDPMYIYAGFNMQGNDPGTNNWVYLSHNNVSVGLWGAHANNMLWLNRNTNGSTPAALQSTYLTSIERYFGNGPQNPAIQLEVKDGACNQGSPTFFGMSALMSARSALNWDLSEEPFISYFNLGNGGFFNWKGERQNDLEWYNIGVQDYLPTWRYWWAPSLLGRDVKEGDVTMKSTFTWDDAYVGGSCLKITGTDDDAYLHLFKTKFGLKRYDVITVSYKLLSGSAEKVSLVLTAEGDETKVLGESYLTVLDSEAEADEDAWQTVTFTVDRQLNSLLNNKTLALMALHFTNAKDLDLLLGEVSIKRGEATVPATPQVTKTAVLANHYKGIDGKIIFNMPNDKAKYEPVYNLDVKTSMFKLYAQGEGGEPVFMGLTTSWAGMYYSAPLTGEGNVRFGVSALSLDHNSESEIAWGEWMSRGEYTTSNDIEISKTTLKPGEGFTVKYTDPRHTPSKWTIYNNAQQKMDEVASATEITVENGYQEVGGYDVVLDEGTANERRFGYFVQVSSPETGAIPEIYTLGVNGEDAEGIEDVKLTLDESVKLSYTGRDADGAGSRGINLDEKLFGASVAELGIQANQSFSVAGWVKLTNLPTGISNFVTVENRAGAWPANNWGFFWSRISQDGKFVYDQVDTCWGMRLSYGADGSRLWNQYDDAKIGVDSWAHFAIVFECNGSAIRSSFYINGVKQTMTNWLSCTSTSFKNATGENGWDDLSQVFDMGSTFAKHGSNVKDSDFITSSYPLSNSDWISFGGTAANINAVQGVLDDFQVWGKAMDDDDVKASMAGLDGDNLPADVIAYWDFENDPAADHSFVSKGSKQAKGYFYEFATGINEGTAGKTYVDPTYSVGCPFIGGTAYKVETLPTWTAKKATITDAEGNGTKGQATFSYKKPGVYNVTLTLANAHGSDSKTFPAIFVDKPDAIEETGANVSDVNTYSVGRTVFVETAGTEAYSVSVYNAAGSLAAQQNVAEGNARVMRVDLPSSGIYVVVVKIAGGKTHSYKLQVK